MRQKSREDFYWLENSGGGKMKAELAVIRGRTAKKICEVPVGLNL